MKPAKLLVTCLTFGFCLHPDGLLLAANRDSSAGLAYTVPLSTGVRLDPFGKFIDLGSMPIGMAIAPEKDKLAVLLSGWREQGVQIVDLKSMQVTETLQQDAAFLGIAFSADGKHLYASGGNDDSILCYKWDRNTATLERKIILGKPKPDKTGSRYPAGIAVSRNGRFLYVVENVGDSLAVVDVESGEVVQRFPTDHYPYGIEVSGKGEVYVSAWGGNTISSFRARDDGTLVYRGRITVGRHPSALLANPSGTRLFVALAGSDQIAVIDTRASKVLRYLDDPAPGSPHQGSTPNALALSADGLTLFVAEADNNAVAIFDISAEEHSGTSGKDHLVGRMPTDWYPTAVIDSPDGLLVLNGKGHGSKPNPDGPIPGEGIKRPLGYDLGQLNGTLRILPDKLTALQLSQLSNRVAIANNWNTRHSDLPYPPFKHVLYIIKENRTYDQVLGDMKEGDGDPALTFYGETVWPNHHALARRFGLFDRFFTNAEVSSQGHIWSTAAYVTDFGEKVIPSAYSDRRAGVDGEEIDEPGDGFLWTLAAKAGVTFRDYGEMVAVPEGWPVTQRELVPDVSPTYPAFDLKTLDQARADAWIAELEQFEKDGNLPQLEIMHLPNDHTAGARAGFRTPRALMADNDLALGRIVEALSRSPYWRDTVIFVLEDDSQAGPDHVDCHRSPFFAISAYDRPGTIHRFVNTTDVVAAIEDILGLDRLSKFDYFSRSLADLFQAQPDLTPFTAVKPQADMDEMNPPKSAAADLSEGLDLGAADRVNDALFNRILWMTVKNGQPEPLPRTAAPLHALQISR
jgi:DNA-binding beta-propeller fold protein YncE